MMRVEPSTPDSTHRVRSSRVPRACDRCRIRKIKCNGKNQCSRCNLDDAICIYTKRKRPQDKAYSKEYVQLLEEQQSMLTRGLKELYRKHQAGEALPDLPTTTNDQVLIQNVLQSLNVLSEDKDSPETDWESSMYDNTNASSARSSICSESFLPNLSNSAGTSPSRTGSPLITTMNQSEFPQQFAQDYSDLASRQPSPTPKASEYTFAEAFADVYLVGGVEWTPSGLDHFVNPCDTTFDMFNNNLNTYSI